MGVWPNYGNDDEGTYIDRAWAVQTGMGAHHGPAPYTYWYDHPPFAWIQLALWTWLTHTFRAGTVAVASGRADMLLYTLVCTALVYVIARRLRCTITISIGAMLLFGLSPLSVESMRMVMLDTIGLPWILGSFALALSPRKQLWAFSACGLCFAAGVLSKETYLTLLPVLLYEVWQRSEGSTRRMCLCIFSVSTFGALAFYPLYAALKGELFAGSGHVSLISSVEWQLYGRATSGSIFKSGSLANATFSGWIHTDPWLLLLGGTALPIAIAVRQFRPIVLAFGTFLVFLVRPGYLPATYITGALPFAALSVSFAIQAIWSLDQLALPEVRSYRTHPRRSPQSIPSRFRHWLPIVRKVIAGVMAVTGVLLVVPPWTRGDRMAMTTNTTVAYQQAQAWISRQIPRSATLLVDDDTWIDLVDNGYKANNVVWLWELDQDPQVRARFPATWKDMDYVVATNALRSSVHSTNAKQTPSIYLALAHSTEIARFGSGPNWVSIYKVDPNHAGTPPWWLPGYGAGRPPTHGLDRGE